MEGPNIEKTSYFQQYIVTFIGALAIMSTGMIAGWSSPFLPLLLLKNGSEIHLSSSEGGWITVAPIIGAPFGCISAAVFIDKIGRKPSLLLVAPLLFISWITVALAKSPTILIFGRVVGGISNGLLWGVLPAYVVEIADKRIRGLLTTSLLAAYNIGVLSINALGMHFSMKTTALMCSFIPVLYFVAFLRSPESPYYLIANNNKRKAELALKRLTGMENVDKLMLSIMSGTYVSRSKTSARILELINNQTNRRALSLLAVLTCFQHASGYLTILYYCFTIFKESNGTINEHISTIIYCIVQLVMAILSAILMDKVGRRPLLITSATLSGCALATLGTFFYLKNKTNIDTSSVGWLPLATLVLCTVTYNIGFISIPTLLMAELFPAAVKGIASCILSILYCVLGTVVGKLFQIIKDEFGLHVPFIAFSIGSLVGAIFIIYFIPETKGKSLEEIQMSLKNGISVSSYEECPLNTDKRDVR